MNRALIAAILFGLAGVSILVGLGQWQLNRLAWKQALVGELETRLSADPVPLPAAPTEADDEYLRVAVAGRFPAGEEIHALVSMPPLGPGFRVISAFETAGENGAPPRRILVDRGFVPEALKSEPRPALDAEVTGALLWPDEVDGFTPDPDLAKNFWFARDLPRMAAHLGAEPILVVAETAPPGIDWPRPWPVTVNLRNTHLEYAVTWFGLAAAWAGMTVGLILRIRRRGGF